MLTSSALVHIEESVSGTAHAEDLDGMIDAAHIVQKSDIADLDEVIDTAHIA